MITRLELLNIINQGVRCPLIHTHLEDREYPTYKKSDVKDLLRDFYIREYVSEYHDCDDQADDMRQYLRKNRLKVGYLKVQGHMKLLFSDGEKLLSIDPGTKDISEINEDVKYIAWW